MGRELILPSMWNAKFRKNNAQMFLYVVIKHIYKFKLVDIIIIHAKRIII